MQRLRQLVRQWAKTAAMEAASFGENWLFLLDYGLRALRVGVLLALWRVVFEGRTDVPLALETVLTYTLMAEVFSSQLDVKTAIQDALWQGTIATHFLRPMGLVSQFASQLLGRWWIDFAFFSVPLLLLAPALGVSPWPASGASAVLFALSLACSISVGLALDIGFAALAVWLEQPNWLVDWTRRAITGLLAGSVIPLALLPWGLGGALEWLPFAALVWAPLAIYTGAGDTLRLLGLQLFWAIALWPLVFALWEAGREKVTGYGG